MGSCLVAIVSVLSVVVVSAGVVLGSALSFIIAVSVIVLKLISAIVEGIFGTKKAKPGQAENARNRAAKEAKETKKEKQDV